MACGRPVVAAGEAGLIGVVDEESLGPAMDTNFGDHGPVRWARAEQLAEAIGRLLQDPPRRAALGRLGRKVTETWYDVETQADMMLEVYRSLGR